MEAKDMAIPGKEQGVFRATTTLPKRGISVLPKPTFPQLEKLKKKSWVKNKIVRIGVPVMALLGGLAGGINEAYQHDLLPVHPVHSAFDNTQDSGGIGENNIIRIDKNTLASIPTVPAVPTPKHDINLLMPIQGLPSDVNINYDKSFTGKNQPLYGSDQTKYAKEQDVKDKIIFRGIPKDTIILAPVDGLLEFYARPRVAAPGTIETVNFFYKSPEGALYQILMSGTPGDLLKPLVNAKPYTYDKNIDESTLRVEVKRGQPIAQTLQSTDLVLNTKAWPSGEIGVGATKTHPTNINLITLPNLGQNKVAIIGK